MSTSKKLFKRKRFFNFSIKKRLQLRMLLKIWSIIFITLLLTGIIFYFYSDINVGKSYRLFHVKADNFLDFLFPVLLAGFFSSLVLGFFAAVFFADGFFVVDLALDVFFTVVFFPPPDFFATPFFPVFDRAETGFAAFLPRVRFFLVGVSSSGSPSTTTVRWANRFLKR